MPPVKCVTAGTLALNITSQNMKNQVALVVLALEQQLLMPRILRCDLDGVRQVLMQLESEASKFSFSFPGFSLYKLFIIFVQSPIRVLCNQY